MQDLYHRPYIKLSVYSYQAMTLVNANLLEIQSFEFKLKKNNVWLGIGLEFILIMISLVDRIMVFNAQRI